jgi:hypothetical protein
MKWIEIIELRSTSNAWKELETILQEFIKQVEKETEKQTVKLYTRMINTDFSIHLFHDSGKIKKQWKPSWYQTGFSAKVLWFGEPYHLD